MPVPHHSGDSIPGFTILGEHSSQHLTSARVRAGPWEGLLQTSNSRARDPGALGLNPVQSLTSWVSLSNFLNLPGPQSPHLQGNMYQVVVELRDKY